MPGYVDNQEKTGVLKGNDFKTVIPITGHARVARHFIQEGQLLIFCCLHGAHFVGAGFANTLNKPRGFSFFPQFM